MQVDRAKCCGCMACMNVCDVGAIQSTTDIHGFIYPEINRELCVECKKCEKNCAFSNQITSNKSIKQAFAFGLKNQKDLFESTSGGAFTAISDIILNDGGLVAGAILDENLSIYHILTENRQKRDMMRKSKYVQSSTEGIFDEVKKALKKGKNVLFTGTPCQCGEMVRIAGENSERLITCDFLCHGVPSQHFFREHISYLERKFGYKIINYVFRDKKYGWSHTEGIQLATKRWVSSKRVQSYRKFFYENVTLRPSCLACPYRSSQRCSDLTVADFWGVNKKLGKKVFSAENNGVSLVMVNSEKGKDLAEKIKSFGVVQNVNIEDIQFKFATNKPKVGVDEKEFWDIFETTGYDGLVNKYDSYSWKKEIEFYLKNFGRKIFRR